MSSFIRFIAAWCEVGEFSDFLEKNKKKSKNMMKAEIKSIINSFENNITKHQLLMT